MTIQDQFADIQRRRHDAYNILNESRRLRHAALGKLKKSGGTELPLLIDRLETQAAYAHALVTYNHLSKLSELFYDHLFDLDER